MKYKTPDVQTMTLPGIPAKRGRPATGKALTNAERQKRYRKNQKNIKSSGSKETSLAVLKQYLVDGTEVVLFHDGTRISSECCPVTFSMFVSVCAQSGANVSEILAVILDAVKDSFEDRTLHF